MKRKSKLLSFSILAFAVVFGACQPHIELEPVEEGDVEATDDIAVTEMAGVSMTVDGDTWDGSAEVQSSVTPLYLEITNHGDAPLHIEYSNFKLVGASKQYQALPVFKYEMADGEPVLMPGFTPVTDPTFTVYEYFVAPNFALAYPDVEVYDRVFVFDVDYYDHFVTVWQDYPFPNVEMQRSALPEGILPAGSKISGFLFFENLKPGEEMVNFLAELENAETHELLGTILIEMEPEVALVS